MSANKNQENLQDSHDAHPNKVSSDYQSDYKAAQALKQHNDELVIQYGMTNMEEHQQHLGMQASGTTLSQQVLAQPLTMVASPEHTDAILYQDQQTGVGLSRF